jgi:hypothetical protein
MGTAKNEVESLLKRLPDDCSFEDIQYHLYVLEKIHRGIERAEKEGTFSQEVVEKRLNIMDFAALTDEELVMIGEDSLVEYDRREAKNELNQIIPSRG